MLCRALNEMRVSFARSSPKVRARATLPRLSSSRMIAIATMKYHCDLRNRKYGLLTDLRDKNNGQRSVARVASLKRARARAHLQVVKRPPDFADRFIISQSPIESDLIAARYASVSEAIVDVLHSTFLFFFSLKEDKRV